MSCRVDDCGLEVVAHGYCAAHYKRHRRGGDLAAPKQERLSPRQRAIEAAIALADADSEDDKAAGKAEANFKTAVSRWRDPLVMAEKGRLGGKASAAGRLAKLSAARRQEIARFAAQARAAKLSPAERSRIGKAAIAARWKYRKDTCSSASASKPTPRWKAGNGPTARQPPVRR